MSSKKWYQPNFVEDYYAARPAEMDDWSLHRTFKTYKPTACPTTKQLEDGIALNVHKYALGKNGQLIQKQIFLIKRPREVVVNYQRIRKCKTDSDREKQCFYLLCLYKPWHNYTKAADADGMMSSSEMVNVKKRIDAPVSVATMPTLERECRKRRWCKSKTNNRRTKNTVRTIH